MNYEECISYLDDLLANLKYKFLWTLYQLFILGTAIIPLYLNLRINYFYPLQYYTHIIPLLWIDLIDFIYFFLINLYPFSSIL